MKTRARGVLVASLLVAGPISAQEAVPSSLSLGQAIEIARTTNPGFLQTRNDEAMADWDVRQSWGALMPSASATGGLSWQGSGETQLGGSLTLGDLGFGNRPSYYGSSYNLGLNYSLDWATLLGPRQSKAQRQTTIAGIGVAEANLVSSVTTGYVEILRQTDAVRISELQLENSAFNLRLAQGQLEVGQVTAIDAGQAEIQVGRAEVTLLQARNRLATSRMRLLQMLGLPVNQDFEVTTLFQLTEPTWNIELLTSLALEDNPELKRRRLATTSADVSVSSAWSSYLPSMSISTGWSGFTNQPSSTDFLVTQAEVGVASTIAQCVRTNDLYARLANPLPQVDCSQFVFTDVQRQSIISGNNQFPFNFTGSPPSLRLSMSIPIFSGFSRQRNLEAARLQRDDLREQLREQELAVQADLAIGLANVRTAYESALLAERNRVLAAQQMNLARERYQLGAITFVELADAQTIFAQAESDRTITVFAYHDSVTTLEALVGTSLRF
ncbi:MAG: TolC family protein [Gemmatimonadetes bacterium]|nr:TolC family protein [Gemmatimonadota bacterium]MDA1104077.1 TolC family protein [Gemmatimonadota bacterium]